MTAIEYLYTAFPNDINFSAPTHTLILPTLFLSLHVYTTDDVAVIATNQIWAIPIYFRLVYFFNIIRKMIRKWVI